MKIFLALSFLSLALLSCSMQSMLVQQTPTDLPTATVPSLEGPTEVATVFEVLDDSRTVCADALNIRSAPDVLAPVVSWLKRGDLVSVREWVGGWGRVGGGWVNGRYLCHGK